MLPCSAWLTIPSPTRNGCLTGCPIAGSRRPRSPPTVRDARLESSAAPLGDSPPSLSSRQHAPLSIPPPTTVRGRDVRRCALPAVHVLVSRSLPALLRQPARSATPAPPPRP